MSEHKPMQEFDAVRHYLTGLQDRICAAIGDLNGGADAVLQAGEVVTYIVEILHGFLVTHGRLNSARTSAVHSL